MKKSNIIAFYGAKGGIGKTTSTSNVATRMAQLGYKVCVIDADPQGNSTSQMGFNKTSIDKTLLDGLIKEVDINEILLKTNYQVFGQIDIVPNHRSTYEEDKIKIDDLCYKEFSLKKLMDPIVNNYDYILVDCPPSLSEMTVCALTFATHVLVPMKVDLYSFEGLSELTEKINTVKYNYNEPLQFSGVFLTMVNINTNIVKQTYSSLKETLNDNLFNTTIRNTVSVQESTFHSMPVLIYDPNSLASKDYINLTNEIIKKIGV